jgi:Polysaccharide biosynthesis/export protein
MPARRLPPFVCNTVLVALGGFLPGCVSAPGPQASPPAAVHTSERSPLLARFWDKTDGHSTTDAVHVVLREGVEVQWSVQSATAPANRSMAGRAIVGPDGTIELGPYGSVHVAGLTYGQAKTAVLNHLSSYVEHPQVTLVPAVPGANANQGVAGRAPAGTKGTA